MPGQTEIVKGIFQLEVEHSQLDKGLIEVAGQYAKVTAAQTKQNDELQKLVDQEAKLNAARAKSQNPTMIVKYDEKLREVRASMEDLTKQTSDFVDVQKTAQKQADGFSKSMTRAFNTTAIQATNRAIKDAEKGMIALNAQAQANKIRPETAKATNEFIRLKNAIKDAKGELAEALAGGNAEAIQAASEKVGQLKDQFKDLNETVENFASGSKFQQIGNIFGSIVSNVAQLDFGRANEQSQTLLKTTKSLTFKESIKGVKDLGSTFVNIGKSLLLNPIFLIASVIGLIISKFDALKNAGGVIGAVFNGIGKAIDVVITAGKDLLDFLGIIDSTKKSLEELIDQQEELIKTTENFFNVSIAKRRAANQSTIKLENEKADAINKALLKELNDTKQNLLEKASSYEDFYNAQKKLIEIGIRASQVATEKDVRNIQVAVDARNKLRKLQQDIVEEQVKGTQFKIDFVLNKGGASQIKEEFELRRRELKRAQAEEKRQAQLDFVDFDGGAKAKLLIDKKYSIIRENLAREESKALLEGEKKRGLEKIEIVRNTEELLSDIAQSQNTLNEEQIAEQKVVILAKFYNDKIKLLENNIKKEKDLGLSTLESEKELATFRKEGEANQIKAQDELSKTRKRLNEENLNEEERHALAVQDLLRGSRLKFNEIEEMRQLKDIQTQIGFEEQKLEALKASGEATAEEVEKQENAVQELRLKSAQTQVEINRQLTAQIIDGTQQILDATFSATNTLLSIEEGKYDQLTALQEKRVEDAKKIAGDGNAELLELEQKRLDDLNKEKEKFVRNQQALAAIELVANATVAIAKAAAQGGVAAPFTIAATLIALAAGLAQARAVASQAAFYEGGLYEGQGYTGDGNPREVGSGVGRKPYTYHKKEFIFNNQTTSKYRDIFEDIHRGKIDLYEWRDKAMAFNALSRAQAAQLAHVMVPTSSNIDVSSLEQRLDGLNNTLKKQTMYFNIDEHGFEGRLYDIRAHKQSVRNKARP